MAPSPSGRAAGENIPDAVPSSSPHGKRGRGKATTTSNESKRAAKVARSSHVEETKAPAEGTAETPTTSVKEEGNAQGTPVANTTENIVKLLANLSSDDSTVIEKALKDLAELCQEENAVSEDNEREIRRLGVHAAAVQAVKKHVDNVLIQTAGIRALCNFTFKFASEKVVISIISFKLSSL